MAACFSQPSPKASTPHDSRPGFAPGLRSSLRSSGQRHGLEFPVEAWQMVEAMGDTTLNQFQQWVVDVFDPS